jgi:hypothetical protein
LLREVERVGGAAVLVRHARNRSVRVDFAPA